MGKDNLLKGFVQDIQLKVSIAVALAVIKTKPVGVTAEEHAFTIQSQFLKLWLSEDDKTKFENKIVVLQQEKLVKDIQNIIAAEIPKQNCLEDSHIQESHEPNIDCESSSESDSDSNEELENVEFIHAMVRLKSLVNSQRPVYLREIHYLNKFSNSEDWLIKARVNNFSEEDSGFGSAKNSSSRWNQMCISSTHLRSMTHSSDTEKLLVKSVSLVLDYLQNQIITGAREVFSSWQGSILEHVCTIIQEAAKDEVCSKPTIDFIQGTLTKIFSIKDINKNQDLEYQFTILAELCSSREVCLEVMNFMIEKLCDLTCQIEGLKIPSLNEADVDAIEKSSHLVKFTSVVLRKWRHFANDKKKTDKSTLSSVNALRKIKSSLDSSDGTGGGNPFPELAVWKECFEKLVVTASEEFPLLSTQVWGLLELTKSVFGTRN